MLFRSEFWFKQPLRAVCYPGPQPSCLCRLLQATFHFQSSPSFLLEEPRTGSAASRGQVQGTGIFAWEFPHKALDAERGPLSSSSTLLLPLDQVLYPRHIQDQAQPGHSCYPHTFSRNALPVPSGGHLPLAPGSLITTLEPLLGCHLLAGHPHQPGRWSTQAGSRSFHAAPGTLLRWTRGSEVAPDMGAVRPA